MKDSLTLRTDGRWTEGMGKGDDGGAHRVEYCVDGIAGFFV